MITMPRAMATATAVVFALSLTACSAANDTPEANDQYCASSAQVQTEVAELRTMVSSGTASRDDISLQVEAISAAMKNTALDTQGLAESVRDDVSAADDAFDAALAAIPAEATVPEAAEAYKAAISAWDAALAGIRTEVGCS